MAGGGVTSIIRQLGQEAKQKAAAEATASFAINPTAGSNARKVPKIFSILDYIDQPWGIGMTLYPAQRFIVKLYYNLPLDNSVQSIRISDMFNTKVLYKFTERDYLSYLYNEGRCNIGEQDHDRRELILAIGRRGGKTALSSLFASYEVYRLLNLYDPQEFYGLPPGNRIQIISVATDKDQASILFNNVTTHLNECDYFKPYISSNTQSHVLFRTPRDIDTYGPNTRHLNGKFVSLNGKASIKVTFRPCVAKGLRGPGNIVIILDEMAHFQNKGGASAKEVYDAVTPSAATFSAKDPNDNTQPVGPVESRIICISSPLGKSGKFFELFEQAMRGGPGSENKLAIQAPTWEINPTVQTDYYREKYHSDPEVFMVEHGAQFTAALRSWIERPDDLLSCIRPGHRPSPQGVPRYPYQMGIDVGLVGDGTSAVITHLEGNVVVLDYHESWYAGVDWRETNPHLDAQYSTAYARGLKDVERLDFDEITQWIIALTRRFYISDALFDRWNGIPLEQKLHKAGLRQFKSLFFTRDVTSKMYQTAKMLMFDERLALYDFPTPVDGAKRHSPLITELLELQSNQISKNLVLVEAPKAVGAHDDMSDALIRAVWLSSERILNQKYAANGFDGDLRPHASMGVNPVRYQMARALAHGIDRKRVIPGRGMFRGRAR